MNRYQQFSQAFYNKLFDPQPALYVAWMRILLFSFFIYKLLSRDYSVFGTAPPEMLNIYPHEVYSQGFSWLGFSFLVDLGTFHWVHWVLPLPGEAALTVIQTIAMACAALVVLFGKGPKNLFAIGAYVLISYLWGYNWRSSGDIDAVFIPLQLMLVYCFFRGRETLTLWKPAPLLAYTRDNGWYVSMALLVFCLYYFYAGVNKVVDISPLGWFDFDLFEMVDEEYIKAQLGYFKSLVPGAEYARHLTFRDDIAVIMPYLFELTIPVMFFRRDWIGTYAAFFIAFHIVTWAVGILFFGLLILWFYFFPLHRLVQPVALVWDSQCAFCAKSVRVCRWLNWLGRVQFIGSDDAPRYTEGPTAGWTPEITQESIWLKGQNSPRSYLGFYAFRRMAWAMPPLWLVLPLLYLPGVPWVGVRVYRAIANNRYRLGCNSQSCSI